MKKLEKEYNVIKTKEQEEMTELKRLRTENKQLKHRCEMLEEESKSLADRLVRGQVSRAEEEETTFVVQRELDALRHTHLETTHQLALAHEKIRSLHLQMEETVSKNILFLYFYSNVNPRCNVLQFNKPIQNSTKTFSHQYKNPLLPNFFWSVYIH